MVNFRFFKLYLLVSFYLFFFVITPIHAWEEHSLITQIILTNQHEPNRHIAYTPIESHLNKEDLCSKLKIQCDKIQWTKFSNSKSVSISEVLSFSSHEPDQGMDQNLNISEDQKYMGGYTGMSSQGFRHMYFMGWSWKAPLRTFHIPVRELGFAPERAKTYLDLARQYKAKGNLFWAYRFLGWGLHYVQDLTQPYHVNQTGSLTLMPWSTLLNPLQWRSEPWNKSVHETTRVIGNYHLSFEQYIDAKLRITKDSRLIKVLQNSNPSIDRLDFKTWMYVLTNKGNALSSKVVRTQKPMLHDSLMSKEIDLANSKPDRFDFSAIEKLPDNKSNLIELENIAAQALSQTTNATMKYILLFNE